MVNRHTKFEVSSFSHSGGISHTHTHTFNGPFSRTTQVSRYQKGKTNMDFTVARDSERQWHQLGHMQVCISLQTDNHASNPPLCFFTGRMPFLPPNQQRQSTEGIFQRYFRGCKILTWVTWPFRDDFSSAGTYTPNLKSVCTLYEYMKSSAKCTLWVKKNKTPNYCR